MLQGQRIDPKELDEILRNLRQLDDDRVYQDPQELLRLQAQVTEGLKRFEYGLRRKVEGNDNQILLSGADEVPEQFRKLVEQYDRRSRRPRTRKSPDSKNPDARLRRRSELTSAARRPCALSLQRHPRFASRRGYRRARHLSMAPRRLPPRGAAFRHARELRRRLQLLPSDVHAATRREAGGQGWWTDYPDADKNFSIRLSELTKTRVSRQANGEPNHFVVQATDDTLFQCPFVEIEDAGTR